MATEAIIKGIPRFIHFEFVRLICHQLDPNGLKGVAVLTWGTFKQTTRKSHRILHKPAIYKALTIF